MLVINKLSVPTSSSRPKPVGIIRSMLQLLLFGVFVCSSPSLQAQNMALSFAPRVITGNVGDTVDVNVITKNFTNVEGMQFTMQWDTSKLRGWKIPAVPGVNAMIRNINPNVTGFAVSSNFNVRDSFGQVVCNYLSATGPISLAANDTILFRVRFVIKNSSSIGLAFSNFPAEPEVTLGDGSFYAPSVICNAGSAAYFEATPFVATCNGSVANNNAKIFLSKHPSKAVKYQYSVGPTFNPATATPGVPTDFPLKDTIKNIPNPVIPLQYTVRVSGQLCPNSFRDRTVIINPANCGPSGCTNPTYSALVAASTCNGNIANNDGKITLTAVTGGVTYQYSLGAAFNKAAAVPPIRTSIPANGVIASTLPNPAVATLYTVRVYATDTTCFADKTVTLLPVNCSCVPPPFVATATPVTCSGTTSNSDGRITLSAFQSGLSYQYSLGTSFNAAAAIPSSPAVIPTNGVIVSNLANPTSSTNFTVRVYSTDPTCFNDKTVTLFNTSCQGTSGQLTFTVSSDSAFTGDQKCIDIKADGFRKINGFQYSHNFDPSKLQFVKIEKTNSADSLPSLDLSSFNTTQAGQGRIMLAWLNPSGAGVNLPNGTTLYRICFNVIGSGGATDSVKITNIPLDAKAVKDTIPSMEFVPAVRNGLFKILGNTSNAIGLVGSIESGAAGSTVCMKVTVTNFKKVTGMQYSMNWDPTKLEFSKINLPATGGLPSLSTASFNTLPNQTNAGKLSVSWSAQDPVTGETLPDNTLIYEVCYKLLGSPGTSTTVSFTDDPVPHEFLIAGSNNDAPWAPVSGTISVTNQSNGTEFKLYSDTLAGLTGDTLCFPVRADNFTNIGGFQFSMGWNPAVAEFVKISYPTPQLMDPALTASNFNISNNQTSAGKLSLTWVATDLVNGQTLPNNSILFYVCLKAKGTTGQSTLVSFTDDPLGHEILDIKNKEIPWTVFPGRMIIGNSPPPPTTSFKLYSDTLVGATGDTICFPVRADNFTKIGGFQFSMGWNPAVAEFVKISYPTPQLMDPALSASNFNISSNQTSAGKLSLTWVATDLVNGQTLPNNSILFYVCLKAKGTTGQSTLVSFTDDPLGHEILDNNSKEIAWTVFPGRMIIGNSPPPPATTFKLYSDTLVGVTGDTLCFPVRADNFTSIGGFQFSMGWNPAVAEFVRISYPTPQLLDPALANSNFNISSNQTSAGKLSLTWVATDLVNGQTLPNNSILFYVCLKAKGSTGQSTLVSFTDDPLGHEILDNKNKEIAWTVFPGRMIIGNAPPPPTTTFKLYSDTLVGATGDTLCFPVRADNFTNVGGFQFSMGWNPAVAEFVKISYPTPQLLDPALTNSNFNISGTNTSAGKLSLTWVGTDLVNGQTLPKNSILFYICLKAKGTAGQNTLVSFTDDPLGHEILDNKNKEIPWTVFPGRLTIGNAPPPPSTTFKLYSDTLSGLTGDTLCFPVRADNFTKIGGFQFSMGWNPSVAEFVRISYPTPQLLDPSLTGSNFNISGSQTTLGKLSITWVATDLVNGQTLPKNSILFYVCLKAKGTSGQSTLVSFTDDPLGHEILDNNTKEIVWSVFPGKMDIVNTPPPPVTATLTSKTDVSCKGGNNGSILLNVIGGKTPYTYNWSPSGAGNPANNLIAGTYNVTVTDANSVTSVVSNILINEPAQALTITGGAVTDEVAGNKGGSVTGISVSGGTAPYTYLWNSAPAQTTINLTNVAAGTYTVTVTDSKLCTATKAFTVKNVANGGPVNLSAAKKDVGCFGGSNGSINLTVSGGNGTFTYLWDNPLVTGQNPTGLTAGTYCVTVTSGANTATTCVTLAQPSDIVIKLDSIVKPKCFGFADGSIFIKVSGGVGPYTYAWSPAPASGTNPTNLPPANYSVTITDSNGCMKTLADLVVPTVNEIKENSRTIIDVKCFGGNDGSIRAVMLGGTPPFTYKWSGTTNTTNNPTGLAAGNYSLTVTDKNNCNKVFTYVVGSNPELIVTGTPSGIVPNGAVALTVNGGKKPYTYEWTGPCSFTATSQNLSALTCGGDYFVTITDSVNCKKVAGPFTVVGNPVVVKETVSGVKCFGETNGTITLDVTGGIQPLTFKWSPNVSTTNVAAGLTAGNYSVSITENGKSVPTYVKTFTITGPTSKVIATLDTVVRTTGCQTSDGQIYISVTGGTAPYAYQWNIGPGSLTIEDRIGLPMGLYKVVVKDVNGCEATLENIAVGSSVKTGYSDLKVTPVKCLNGADGKIAMTIYGCPPYNLKWGPSASQMYVNSLNTNIVIDDLSAGNYSLTLTSASDPAPLVLNVNVATKAVKATTTGVTQSNTIPNTNCNGRINMNVSPIGVYTYSWLDNASVTTKDRTGLCAGSYTVIIKNSDGCEVGDTTFVVGNEIAQPLTVSLVSKKDEGCKGNADGTIIIRTQGGVSPLTYLWKDSKGNTIPGRDTLRNIPMETYSVTIIDAASTQIVLNNISITSLSSLGSGATVNVNTSATTATVVVIGVTGTLTYKWSSPITSTGPTATGLTPETTYSVTIEDAFCTVVKTFTTNCVLSAQISADKGVSCANTSDGVARVSNVLGCKLPYTYKWDNNVLSDLNTTLSAGNHTVTVTDASGTFVVLSVTIPTTAPMTLTFTTKVAGCDGAATGNAEVAVKGGTAPYSYQWNIPSGNTAAKIENIIQGNYFVTVTDKNLCTTSGFVLVGDDCTEVTCFNSMGMFTPNNDGVNETFQFNLCDYEKTYLQVFNRWGQRVHEARNFPGNNAWDGRLEDGTEAPEGGYFYVLEVTRVGKTELFKGSITLLR